MVIYANNQFIFDDANTLCSYCKILTNLNFAENKQFERKYFLLDSSNEILCSVIIHFLGCKIMSWFFSVIQSHLQHSIFYEQRNWDTKIDEMILTEASHQGYAEFCGQRCKNLHCCSMKDKVCFCNLFTLDGHTQQQHELWATC